jgi:hypothetical protein
MFEEWGWREWIAAVAVFWLLMDIHRRASVAMDAVLRIERRLNAERDRRGGWSD